MRYAQNKSRRETRNKKGTGTQHNFFRPISAPLNVTNPGRGLMGHRARHSSSSMGFLSRSDADLIEFVDVSALADLEWPFERIDSIHHDGLRETAYEILVVACRSSPGFGGRVPLTYHSSNHHRHGGGEGRRNGTSMSGGVVAGASTIKKTLGLKTKQSTNGVGSASVTRRPVTLANVMRQQMRATEVTDQRIRKTLMRTLVGQVGRSVETIILPLELLRHVNPSEFSDIHEYHLWQKRQLKILQLGLLDHPSVPLEGSDPSGIRLFEIIRSGEFKPIDTNKNSETMSALCNCVVALAWRGSNESCHWVDGSPFNVHIYVLLLQTIFDLQEETFVLDEIDDMLDLMKKTWDVLGIIKPIHNLCFAWVLFQQFVATGQTEYDLLCAMRVVLTEIGNDAKRGERRDPVYGKILSSTLTSIQGWVEKWLLDYHESFGKVGGGDLKLMENLLPLPLMAASIIIHGEYSDNPEENGLEMDLSGNRVDYYIRSSLRNAFNKIMEENQNIHNSPTDPVESSEHLLRLASEIEELALKEEYFSVILKKYHPIPAGVAAATLHSCYSVALKQYMARKMKLSPETLQVLQTAGKLENLLIQMVVDDSEDCSDGGKSVVREMVPYEVESVILGLIRTWIHNKLEIGRECLNKAKDVETWGAISKEETHAQSAIELISTLREAVDDLFEIPVTVPQELVQEFAEALEGLIREYATFTGSCGSRRSYIPKLPPLTRCNKESRLRNVWRKVTPCRAGVGYTSNKTSSLDSNHPRPSTSRGTRRLYVRLNTLHYLYCNLHFFDHSLSLHNRQTPSTTDATTHPRPRRRNSVACLSYSSHRFDLARTSIQSAIQHVAEVVASRLIFFDSNHSFHEGLYSHDVANARIRPALRTLKQNLTLLTSVAIERAQPLLIREVMKASFEAFLVVLLAGGNERAYSRADHEMVEEDFEGLKRVFATCGDGILEEQLVNQEADAVEGIIALMGFPTEQLIDDFSIIACEANGVAGGLQKVPMPPTTGRWNRSDPNTILRVLCYRNDDASDRFLKKTFQLPKRR